jgi:flavodoxin
MESIIFTHSYHHRNTQKIAEAIATKRGAAVIEMKKNPGGRNQPTRSIFTLVGGKNKGRPNSDDIRNAESFAEKIEGTVL